MEYQWRLLLTPTEAKNIFKYLMRENQTLAAQASKAPIPHEMMILNARFCGYRFHGILSLIARGNAIIEIAAELLDLQYMQAILRNQSPRHNKLLRGGSWFPFGGLSKDEKQRLAQHPAPEGDWISI